MNDVLVTLTPSQLAAFYGRLADAVDKGRGSLTVSLAALLMRQWLKNRDPKGTFEFEAPDHLKNRAPVLEVLRFHRRVYLTQGKARFTGGIERWAGIVPRLMGRPPFQKWGESAAVYGL